MSESTSPGGAFELVASALTGHARTLTGLAGELRGAADAAGAVSLTGEAYGKAGQKFAAAITALGTIGAQALREGVASLETDSATMTATVAAYQRNDEAEANRLNRIGDYQIVDPMS